MHDIFLAVQMCQDFDERQTIRHVSVRDSLIYGCLLSAFVRYTVSFQ